MIVNEKKTKRIEELGEKMKLLFEKDSIPAPKSISSIKELKKQALKYNIFKGKICISIITKQEIIDEFEKNNSQSDLLRSI